MEKAKVLIARLVQDVYVRQELNLDRVMYLAELIKGGTRLDPIRINPEFKVIDGRHRIAAYDLLDLKEIDAEIERITDPVRLIAAAYRANIGGSLPPTKEDTEQTILLLLDRNVNQKQIGDLLRLPAGYARTLISTVKSKRTRKLLQSAASAITHGGLNLAQAAENYNIEPAKLREFIAGTRKHKVGVDEMQRQLTTKFKSHSQEISALCRKLMQKYDDGDMTAEQVLKIFDHLAALAGNSAKNVREWEDRFKVLTSKNGEKAVANHEGTT